MPVFNQPFRVYWAYNPTRVDEFLQQPIVAGPQLLPERRILRELAGDVRTTDAVRGEAFDLPLHHRTDVLRGARSSACFTMLKNQMRSPE